MSLAPKSAKQRKEKHDTDSAKQTTQKTHGAAPKQTVDTKESKISVKELKKMSKDSESTMLRQSSNLFLEKEKQHTEIQKLQEENTKLKLLNEEYKNLKEELEKTKDLLAQKESEITNLKEDIHNLQKRSTGEVGLENLNHCRDVLLQDRHDYVLSGHETTPEAMMQPVKVQHEPLLLERDHTFQEVRGKFVTLERGSSHASGASGLETKDSTSEFPDKCQSPLSTNCEQTGDIAKTNKESKMGHHLQGHKAHEDHGHNSANLTPASKTTVIAVNCKTDFHNVTKNSGDTERSENRNNLNESGNDPRHAQVEKGDDEENEEGSRTFEAKVCTENLHEEASTEDKDKHKIKDMEFPAQELTDEKNAINRPSLEGKGDNDNEEERNRILKAEPCTENIQKEDSTEDKYKQKTEAVKVPVQGMTDENATLLKRPSQVKKEEKHEEGDREDRNRILNEESCIETLHQEAGTDEKYKIKIEELEARVKELTNEKNQLLNRPSEVKTKKEEERKQILKAELGSVYPHEQAETEEKYKRKIEQLEACVKDLTSEKNKLLNRLSEIGAMKMTDNNPNVTDLSDDNRPEKLVEQFSELYDNEWTDAYVYLTKAGKTMELSVKLLLQILKDAYDICLTSATDKATTLRTALLSYAGLSDEDSSELELQKIEMKLSEYRTKKSQCNIARIEEKVKQKFRNQSDLFEVDMSSPLTSYINAGVRICWFMCIKNPPMLLDFGEREESAATNDNKPMIRLFDRSKFMPYTKSGEYVAYVTWPAVFAHEDGPIMRKGVAQGSHEGNGQLKTN